MKTADLEKAAREYAEMHSSAPDKETPAWIINDFKAGAQWAASQFRESSPEPEPDFDGPLAMVDHYQKLARYFEKEAIMWENKYKAAVTAPKGEQLQEERKPDRCQDEGGVHPGGGW